MILNDLYSIVLVADIYDDLDIQLDEIGLVCECLGGGKIYHDPVDLTLEISGESEVKILTKLLNILIFIRVYMYVHWR